MLKVVVRWCIVVCGECYNLGKINRCVVFVLYFVFENSKNTRNDLPRPIMGTIFLVILHKCFFLGGVSLKNISAIKCRS